MVSAFTTPWIADTGAMVYNLKPSVLDSGEGTRQFKLTLTAKVKDDLAAAEESAAKLALPETLEALGDSLRRCMREGQVLQFDRAKLEITINPPPLSWGETFTLAGQKLKRALRLDFSDAVHTEYQLEKTVNPMVEEVFRALAKILQKTIVAERDGEKLQYVNVNTDIPEAQPVETAETPAPFWTNSARLEQSSPGAARGIPG